MIGAPASPANTAAGRLRGVRVLFALPSLGLGGAERQAVVLARWLAAREGASVRIAVFGDITDPLGDVCDGAGIPWERFRLWHKTRGRAAQLVDLVRFSLLLRRRRIQVVLPYCMFQNIFAGLTWRLGGARLCIWNQRDEGRQRAAPWLERLAVSRTPCFVSNSRHGADFIRTALGVRTAAIHVVYNGVEAPAAAADRGGWRRRLGLGPDAFAACMVANFHEYKDHATLVASWRGVTDRLALAGRAAHLLLVGHSGPTTDAVRRQIADLNLSENIHLLGVVPDIGGLMAAADLLVHSSHAEGVPNAVLEAMAAGLAVVANDEPGIIEALGPDAARLLARPRDPQNLAERIIAAALDPALRTQLGAAGRARVASEFTVERMCEAMTALIAAGVGRAQPGARLARRGPESSAVVG